MQYSLALSCGLLLLAACSQRSPAGERGLAWIEISTNDGWLVMVESDGSGYLAYGPFAGQRVRFPTATFDFKDLRRDIRLCSDTYTGRHALSSRIFSARSQTIEQYYCADSLIGQQWLGAAYEALPRHPEEPFFHRRLCRRWRERPPLDLAVRE